MREILRGEGGIAELADHRAQHPDGLVVAEWVVELPAGRGKYIVGAIWNVRDVVDLALLKYVGKPDRQVAFIHISKTNAEARPGDPRTWKYEKTVFHMTLDRPTAEILAKLVAGMVEGIVSGAISPSPSDAADAVRFVVGWRTTVVALLQAQATEIYKRHHPRAGFTLVELLVVVVIIAIVLSLLLPGMAHVRAKGRRIACTSNLRSMATLTVMYADANRKLPASAELFPDLRVLALEAPPGALRCPDDWRRLAKTSYLYGAPVYMTDRTRPYPDWPYRGPWYALRTYEQNPRIPIFAEESYSRRHEWRTLRVEWSTVVFEE